MNFNKIFYKKIKKHLTNVTKRYIINSYLIREYVENGVISRVEKLTFILESIKQINMILFIFINKILQKF